MTGITLWDGQALNAFISIRLRYCQLVILGTWCPAGDRSELQELHGTVIAQTLFSEAIELLSGEACHVMASKNSPRGIPCTPKHVWPERGMHMCDNLLTPHPMGRGPKQFKQPILC